MISQKKNLKLSPAYAERALTDSVFPNKLIREQLNQQSGPSPSTHESEASLYRWSLPCVLLLLETYRGMEKDFSNRKFSQKKIRKELPRSSVKKNIMSLGPNALLSYKALKKYKSIKYHNSNSGNDRRCWQYLEVSINLISFISRKCSTTTNNKNNTCKLMQNIFFNYHYVLCIFVRLWKRFD
ncbi:hypothetical protein WA026_011210 [Henosepilachna vigintioctopunctata]|uniref:Uncharacterized protein n=1 Tax=Henosepilachna vigintioctopunctata TaxID=420089 RepID=A0AAW1U634_9CUCU